MLLYPFSVTLPVAALAAGLEALCGYPAQLFATISHPVVWIGSLINRLEQTFNRPEWSETTRRVSGFFTFLLLVGIPVGLTVFTLHIGYMLLPSTVMIGVQAIAACTLIAQKSLWVHVKAVATALQQTGLEGGRKAVSQIVGRDTSTLDEAAVIRAALESLAENFSDGIVAPLFWTALFGLPGTVFYKAINTADSMIGHLSPRYAAFGMVSAKMDDLINLPASRLAALCILLASSPTQWQTIWATVWRDARRHRSPNAGWPETALATALGVKFGGPRIYAGRVVDDGWIGEGATTATLHDLEHGLILYRRACGILMGGLLLGAIGCMINA
ncbi:cobalamin biosynthesis protein CobD [Acetobacter aceti 1023]|nr:cobalamin biosynthesis protein CobD [Acetobacter aceti 1023]